MEQEIQKEFEKEISKIETNELIDIYQKVEKFIDYLQKQESYE